MDQSKKREQIQKIKSDQGLTEKEKNIKIQQLMSNNYLESNIKTKTNENKTCSHYTKKCSRFVFECCDIIDPCVRCHRERECCEPVNIKVKEIICNECGFKQQPKSDCDGCGIRFNKSYCGICYIWTDKDITHCVDCGICRIGTAETLYHCTDCETCFNIDKSKGLIHECVGKQKNEDNKDNTNNKDNKSNNKKITKWTDGLCVICTESTFNSQSESFSLPCTHLIHSNCFNEYILQSNYKCPYCKKSICDLTTQWNFIRSQIKLYPISNEMIPIEPEDIVDTPYGKFRVLKINIVNGTKLFEGEFVNWFLDSKLKHNKLKHNVNATLNYSCVKKNLYKNIYCNDCGKNSKTPFHFYGLECIECGSFNTQE